MNDSMKPIAIQGFEGSFHQQAAHFVFGKEAPMLFCASFRDLMKAAKDRHKTSAAVMAIENSIAGSILPNYNLLHQSNQVITGEIYLHIRQQLIVNPGVSLEDIREVHSHPMALQQCFDFLDQYNWKLVETEDTALSAKHLKQHKSKHVAAIAGKLAAEIFDLKVIVPNIQTLKNNYTRFLILQRDAAIQIPANANKASVYFHTDHSRGSLAKVLTAIAGCGINLSKLQSFPIPGSEWLYAFHADMEFEQQKNFTEVMKKIKPLTKELKLYGVYKKGETK